MAKKEKQEAKIQEITDKKVWEEFNLSLTDPSYFQSWIWGNIQKKVGIPVKRFGFLKNDKLLLILQIFEIKAKRGHYLHIRQGPVFTDIGKGETLELIRFLKEYALDRKASFIRISPLLKYDSRIAKCLKENGFKNSPIHNVDGENSWILRLDKGLDEIMKNMRKTTRYMIRRGDSMGIKVVRTDKLLDLNKFMKIYEETAQMKNFVPHSHIKQEFEEFINIGKSFLYLAYGKKKLLAGALITYYGNQAIYRHGATSRIGRKTSASYLLQWEAIKDAKEKGLGIYNFFGIAKDENKNDPWYGLSQFKIGFGGERNDFIHSLDLPIKKKYWVTFLIDYLMRLKKGYL